MVVAACLVPDAFRGGSAPDPPDRPLPHHFPPNSASRRTLHTCSALQQGVSLHTPCRALIAAHWTPCLVLSMVTLLSTPSDSLASTIPSGVSVFRASVHPNALSSGPEHSSSPPFSSNPQGGSGRTGGTLATSIVAYAALEPGENKDTVRGSATVGVPTAVARSMLLQALQFWYRVPIKVRGCMSV